MTLPSFQQPELLLEVMGTSAHIAVRGGPQRVAQVTADRLRELEGRWSRFLPDSEVSQLNQAMGKPVRVTPETLRLLSVAVEAWHRTGGAFDPTIYEALVALGYDRTFDDIRPIPEAASQFPAPGCGGIEIDFANSAVRLPLGVHFDPGGIGKGLAADIAVAEAMALGADGALVDIGGDVRTAGVGPNRGYWSVSIDEPGGIEGTTVVVGQGAVASSTTKRRCWSVGGSQAHHLLDPATGSSMQTPWGFVTTIAGEAWWADAATKALMLNGPEAPLPGVAARLVAHDGSQVLLGDFAGFIR